MKLINCISIFWLLVARFHFNDDATILGNLLALGIAMFLIKNNKGLIYKFTLIITLSVFFSSLLTFVEGSDLFGVIAAFIFFYLGFKPDRKWKLS